jgi:uncharacterized membrane protein YqjE
MNLRREFNGTTDVNQQESFTELLAELAGKSAMLVREEVSLARQELKENIRDIKPSVTMLVLGMGGAVLAVISLLAALVLALSQYWEPWQAALAVGIGLAVTAGIIISVALSKMKRARIKPEQTLVTLEENKEWLKEMT